MNTDALLSALLKFQAWCDDNESLLRENSELQEKLAAAQAQIESLRQAVKPFEAVGRSLDPRMADYLCTHYDHFYGHYRELVKAVEALDHE